MELVYLWVEDYKNIHKQGFNFSPRFRCEYDEDKNELTIEENKDYIDGFFGKNINVTAIMGKNGSGKSSLLEVLEKYNYSYLEIRHIIVYTANNTLYCKYRLDSNLKLDNKTQLKLVSGSCENLDDMKSLSAQFLLNDTVIGDGFKGLKIYSTSGWVQMHASLGKTYILSSPTSFVPLYLQIYDKSYDVLSRLTFVPFFDALRIKFEYKPEIEIREVRLKPFIDEPLAENIKEINKQITNFINSLENRFIQSLLIGLTEFFLAQSDDIYIVFITQMENFIKKGSVVFSDIESLLCDISEAIESAEHKALIAKVLSAIQLISRIGEIRESFIDIKIEKDLFPKIDMLTKVFEDKGKDKSLRLCTLDLIHKETGTKYSTLSSGEKQFLRFALEFSNYFEQSFLFNVILLDEPDNSLHPSWKKKMISMLMELMHEFKSSGRDIDVHIILTTHSPFIVSDLPKENVIFLKDGEQDKGVAHKQTFGANIHTLLSDSFFMDDGLMGEFAKEKINKAIKILNEVKPSKEDLAYCEQIISIIGEPIIKNQLQKMLDSKRLSKVEEIDKLKEEMELIQERIKKLEDD